MANNLLDLEFEKYSDLGADMQNGTTQEVLFPIGLGNFLKGTELKAFYKLVDAEERLNNQTSPFDRTVTLMPASVSDLREILTDVAQQHPDQHAAMWRQFLDKSSAVKLEISEGTVAPPSNGTNGTNGLHQISHVKPKPKAPVRVATPVADRFPRELYPLKKQQVGNFTQATGGTPESRRLHHLIGKMGFSHNDLADAWTKAERKIFKVSDEGLVVRDEGLVPYAPDRTSPQEHTRNSVMGQITRLGSYGTLAGLGSCNLFCFIRAYPEIFLETVEAKSKSKIPDVVRQAIMPALEAAFEAEQEKAATKTAAVEARRAAKRSGNGLGLE